MSSGAPFANPTADAFASARSRAPGMTASFGLAPASSLPLLLLLRLSRP